VTPTWWPIAGADGDATGCDGWLEEHPTTAIGIAALIKVLRSRRLLPLWRSSEVRAITSACLADA
jgi:hypothetical protein